MTKSSNVFGQQFETCDGSYLTRKNETFSGCDSSIFHRKLGNHNNYFFEVATFMVTDQITKETRGIILLVTALNSYYMSTIKGI